MVDPRHAVGNGDRVGIARQILNHRLVIEGQAQLQRRIAGHVAQGARRGARIHAALSGSAARSLSLSLIVTAGGRRSRGYEITTCCQAKEPDASHKALSHITYSSRPEFVQYRARDPVT